MDDSEIALALAFRTLIQRTGKSQKVIASEIGLRTTGLSKIFNFKQGLTFLQVHTFCLKYGFDISEVSQLVVKISGNKNILKSVRDCLATKKQINTAMENLLSWV